MFIHVMVEVRDGEASGTLYDALRGAFGITTPLIAPRCGPV